MKYIFLFLLVGTLNISADVEGCMYHSKKTKQFDLMKEKECITLKLKNGFIDFTDNDAYISKKVINDSYYNENNLSYINTKSGTYYFNNVGKVKKVLNFDNGADYFRNGLCRTINKNNKIGFMDTKLNIIIKPQFDFAYPFKDNKSIVCQGCKEKMIDGHTIRIGGKWGIINSKGTIIQPLSYSSFGKVYEALQELDYNDNSKKQPKKKHQKCQPKNQNPPF